ncbi:MAG: HAMP domain-containing histidine kinase [Deltaproteobacteria bacterium]|nr:HAMP domain-containing histidine kinase [Deltaproteobacteria bacterium]
MSFRARVLGSTIGLLLLTVMVVWLVAGGGVLRPFVGELQADRVELVRSVAVELEQVHDPDARALELADRLNLDLQLLDHPPHRELRDQGHMRRRLPTRPLAPGRPGPRGGVMDMDDGSTAVVVPLTTSAGRRWLLMRFQVDLAAPMQRAAVGVLLVAGLAVLLAWMVIRWALQPLALASSAMARVADGDLEHRVPEGSDATGQIGHTFNRMAERVEALVVGQRQLMAAVSHELRTPLTRLRLQVELLRDTDPDNPRVSAMEANIEEVDALVEELLESARLDQGVLALHFEDLAVTEVVEAALATVALGERGISVRCSPALRLLGDRTRLVRAVSNLLSNASRYTPPDAAVEISAGAREGGGVVLVVEDRGPGVSPESLPHLFDPFFREERSRSRATGGLGLGLMLVRQIAEAHGGGVTAVNRVGGGLRVSLELPAP